MKHVKTQISLVMFRRIPILIFPKGTTLQELPERILFSPRKGYKEFRYTLFRRRVFGPVPCRAYFSFLRDERITPFRSSFHRMITYNQTIKNYNKVSSGSQRSEPIFQLLLILVKIHPTPFGGCPQFEKISVDMILKTLYV